MAKGVLLLALNGGAPLAADELSPLQGTERALEAGCAAFACERPGPEHLPDHRRVLEQRLLVPLQPVQASRDQSLYRFGHGQLVVGGAQLPVGDHARELLGVERVATGAREHGSLHLGRQDGSLEDRVHDLGGLCL